MTFEEFKTNVEAWAEARGIYEHSTALAQALKAVSEVGELADAVIKGDREALKDAIGDVAVCLVNVARMTGELVTLGDFDLEDTRYKGSDEAAALIAFQVGDIATDMVFGMDETRAARTFDRLKQLAKLNGLTFEECCTSAWNEIKDRKGRMVAGGAFVKDEQPSIEEVNDNIKRANADLLAQYVLKYIDARHEDKPSISDMRELAKAVLQ